MICSTYNSLPWIDFYLDSLNEQSLKEFEVVFLDASSTDDSLEKIKAYQFREGISKKILEQPTRISITESMNIGVKKASGEFIVIYSADDYLFPMALSTYEEYLTNHPTTDFIYSNFFVHESASPYTITGIRIWPDHTHEALLKFCYCGPFPCIRKTSLIAAGDFNTKYLSSADYDMWLRLSKNGAEFLKIKEVIGSFCFRQASASNQDLSAAQAEDREIQSLNA